ncbi:helix-turn-helix domain-containing protein [Ligilactobacillus agilis]|uniref:helix-turn-helix domain-containing protein n=1 Tax=Ligilactobacillus agilis TaxID=1601 RepID=UPI003364E417
MLWEKMKDELDKQDMSVYQLVKKTGIKESTIWNYRNGVEPSFKNMCKIADALDVSLDVFRKEDKSDE